MHLAWECHPGQNSLVCACGRSEAKACKSELKVHLARKLTPNKIHFMKQCRESVQKRKQSALKFFAKFLYAPTQVQDHEQNTLHETVS